MWTADKTLDVDLKFTRSFRVTRLGFDPKYECNGTTSSSLDQNITKEFAFKRQKKRKCLLGCRSLKIGPHISKGDTANKITLFSAPFGTT